MDEPYRVFVGIDWADQAHQVCATDPAGRVVGERQVPHGGKGLGELADWVIGLSDGEADAVAVAIETPHGPIVDTLLDRGCHVYAINPKQLDRFRDRFSPSGAKDDRRDARVLSSGVRTDRQAFRRVSLSDPLTLQLREATRQDAELQEDLQRLENRLRDLLVRVWPELLRLVPAANEPWFWALLRYAPLPGIGAAPPLGRVRRILEEHHIRRLTAEEVVAVLRAPSVYLAPGVRQGVAPRVGDLLEQLGVVYAHRQQATVRLKAALQALAEETPAEQGREHRDAEILQSLPGIGVRIAATMLAEAADGLRERDYHGLRTLAGLAPVTKRSGKSYVVQMRYACHQPLRRACYWLGMAAIRSDEPSRRHYEALRAKGHPHGRALRGVVDRLLQVLVAMLKNGSLYDASRRRSVSVAA